MKDYVEYDPIVLEKLQATELSMLEDFANSCEKRGIDWFCIGGTAIGAVRHGGMIPWDDDIDLAFMKEETDRIIQAVKEDYGDKYWFASGKLVNGFPYIPIHMCLAGTVFREQTFDVDYPSGIFLDLYPFENASDSKLGYLKQSVGSWFWGKMYVLYYASDPVLYVYGLTAKAVQIACKAGNKAMHALHVNPRKMYDRALRLAAGKPGRDNENTKRIAWFFDKSPMVSTYRRDRIFPTRKVPFKGVGVEVRLPKDLDELLCGYYGDYMVMPPEDKRHNHPPLELKFND